MAVTPNYSWPVPVATDYVKDGWEAISDLGNAIDTTVAGLGASALTLIKSQTIGTAVSSVSVTDVFSATYDAYKIIISNGVTSVDNKDGYIQMTGSTASYAFTMLYSSYGSSSVAADGSGSQTYQGYAFMGSTNDLRGDITVINPFIAKHTQIQSSVFRDEIGGVCAGVHKVNASYTGFTIGLTSGTMTGGTINVYGYKKA